MISNTFGYIKSFKANNGIIVALVCKWGKKEPFVINYTTEEFEKEWGHNAICEVMIQSLKEEYDELRSKDNLDEDDLDYLIDLQSILKPILC